MSRLTAAAFAAAFVAAHSVAESGAPRVTDSLPAYTVADASAPVVTQANLVESERFWPYQVALTKPSPPTHSSATELPAGSLGVLIRVEVAHQARLDFGRDGLITVPVSATDLIARANAIRTGATVKTAANFAFAIGPRLVDADSEAPVRLEFAKSMDRAGFLCFFTDPTAPSFPKLAGALAPLAGRDGVLAVLFPQGEHVDSALHTQLRAAGWKGAFVVNHLSEAYTRTLIDSAIKAPTLALYSAEGRVLWTGVFDGTFEPEFERAWAEAFATRG